MLTDPTLADLDAFCARLVAAATTPAARAVAGARNFPRGLCTWACHVGGELLDDHGFGAWTIWNAAADGETTFPRHDWLVRDDVFVDLTSGQFSDWPTYLVGRGPSPLAARFPVRLASYPAVIPLGDDIKREWKRVIAAEIAALDGA